MSYSFISASSKFVALCQSQLELLKLGLGAVWSAVYLTEELVEDQQGKLIPLAVYPQNYREQEQQWATLSLPEIGQSLATQSRLSSMPLLTGTIVQEKSQQTEYVSSTPKLILPLIYDNKVIGLLVTVREDRNWRREELEQIDKIRQTLAIARCLDHRYQWYQQQLIAQKNLLRLEHDQFDDLLHQLRNPLTALRTFSKLLIKRLLPEDRNQSVAYSILRESDRLQELLQQFEANLKSEATPDTLTLNTTSLPLLGEDTSTQQNFLLPSQSAELESVKIKTILEPLLISLIAIAEEKEVELTSKLPDDLPLVVANAQALREVFNNLIDNAIKYTPKAGKVNIYSQEKQSNSEGKMLGIAIRDTGYGIPVQDQPKIFERHYRGVQAEGAIHGSGLGLAIAQALVEKMGGRIELISPNNFGKNKDLPGTTFIVWLNIASSN